MAQPGMHEGARPLSPSEVRLIALQRLADKSAPSSRRVESLQQLANLRTARRERAAPPLRSACENALPLPALGGLANAQGGRARLRQTTALQRAKDGDIEEGGSGTDVGTVVPALLAGLKNAVAMIWPLIAKLGEVFPSILWVGSIGLSITSALAEASELAWVGLVHSGATDGPAASSIASMIFALFAQASDFAHRLAVLFARVKAQTALRREHRACIQEFDDALANFATGIDSDAALYLRSVYIKGRSAYQQLRKERQKAAEAAESAVLDLGAGLLALTNLALFLGEHKSYYADFGPDLSVWLAIVNALVVPPLQVLIKTAGGFLLLHATDWSITSPFKTDLTEVNDLKKFFAEQREKRAGAVAVADPEWDPMLMELADPFFLSNEEMSNGETESNLRGTRDEGKNRVLEFDEGSENPVAERSESEMSSRQSSEESPSERSEEGPSRRSAVEGSSTGKSGGGRDEAKDLFNAYAGRLREDVDGLSACVADEAASSGNSFYRETYMRRAENLRIHLRQARKIVMKWELDPPADLGNAEEQLEKVLDELDPKGKRPVWPD